MVCKYESFKHTCIPAIIVVCTMYIHVSLYNPFIVFSMELHMYNKHHHFLPLLCSFSFSLTYLCRAGAISSESPVVTLKVLPSLIRLCKRKLDMELRAEATGTLGKAIASYLATGGGEKAIQVNCCKSSVLMLGRRRVRKH